MKSNCVNVPEMRAVSVRMVEARPNGKVNYHLNQEEIHSMEIAE